MAATSTGFDAAITALPSDVLSHILSLLDGPSLASSTSASSHLRALSRPHWRNLSYATWPSTADPRVASSFSDAFQSLYADAYPRLYPVIYPCANPTPADRLISAVDLRHGEALIFSKLVETETMTSWFLSSPFRIDALDRNESPPSVKSAPPVNSVNGDLTLSWIVIDPLRRRAANFSSRKPVSVQRHWLTGEIQVRFATVLSRFGDKEPVKVEVLVTCEGCTSGLVHVREVSLYVEDLDGMNLCGRDSLVILQGAMEGSRAGRKRADERERYLEFSERKREKKERMLKREGRLDMVCVVAGVWIFAVFMWVLLLK